MPKIFISYRRADTTDVAGRIFDRLSQAFGKQVFKDVDSIPFGSDFSKVIAERLNDCNVVIVVIGRNWLTVKNEAGRPRLQEPSDYVRIEIEQALRSDALVVPALIGNVPLPRQDQLPESLRSLTRKHAIAIRPDPDFHRDMDRLIASLRDSGGTGRRAQSRRLVLIGGALLLCFVLGWALWNRFMPGTTPRVEETPPMPPAPTTDPSAWGSPPAPEAPAPAPSAYSDDEDPFAPEAPAAPSA